MNSLKVSSIAAALVLAVTIPTASFAQHRGGGGGGGVHFGGGGFGGGGRVGGPSFGGPRVGGFGGGRVAGPAPFSGARVVGPVGPGIRYGGNYRGGGFWPGVVAGAAIGTLGTYSYYGPGYYDPNYYDEPAYDTGVVAPGVAVAPDGGDDVAYCMQQFRSYDPASGTYLGYDGLRHPCP